MLQTSQYARTSVLGALKTSPRMLPFEDSPDTPCSQSQQDGATSSTCRARVLSRPRWGADVAWDGGAPASTPVPANARGSDDVGARPGRDSAAPPILAGASLALTATGVARNGGAPATTPTAAYARRFDDDGARPRRESVAAPTSSGASLASAFATGSIGSSPGWSRTAQINALAPARLGLAFWVYALLVVASTLVLVAPKRRHPPLRLLARTTIFGPLTPCAAPLSDRVYRCSAVALSPRTCAPSGSASPAARSALGSDAGTTSTHMPNGNRGNNRSSGRPPPGRLGISTTSDTTARPRRSVRVRDELSIMYWNINHDFTLKLTSPEVQSFLTYDIMFFAETDMLPGEEDAADIPRGYTVVSLPRKPYRKITR
ncbi:hypothetical protein DFH07DRAFT_957723 [Mycena maculata]|uniref:Uncharacterized protein n=1 Tax=Mycena maculata TaxID=230809 RepID=A0AAD7JB78_9AGAR|nr:hypothetical protein DFH07DRAFT_957723 [Mycena maculata]